MRILSRYDPEKILFEDESECLGECVVAAIRANANLYGADLRGANLREADLSRCNLGWADLRCADLGEADLRCADLGVADLSGADLGEADLRGANLRGANLNGCKLRGADLRGANLRGADLRGTNLRGADLRGAYLKGAYLDGCNLRGSKIAWQSHLLLAHILLVAAGSDVQRRMLAGLVAVSTDWCWDKFVGLAVDHRDWALRELAKWITDDDGHPAILDRFRGEQEDGEQ